MTKKIFFLGVVLLLTGQLLPAQEFQLITLTADGTEASYALTNVQKIVFENNAMSVKLKSGSSVTSVTRISFCEGGTGFEKLEAESSIFVFPSLVQSNLTVSGTAKDLKINLLDLNGTLLKSVPAQDKVTNIDVSALQPGMYFLQLDDKTVKFIKK